MTANGNGDQLPEDRIKTVEAGLNIFQQVQAERDGLKRQIEKQEQMLTVAKIEIEGLRADYAAQQSRLESYQHERDQAVAHCAAYETLFATIQAQLRVFTFPSTPLVKEVADAVQSREPDRGDLGGPIVNEFGSGQRPAVSHASTSQGEVSRRTPVLAHAEPMLGQRPGRPKPSPSAGRRFFPGDPTS